MTIQTHGAASKSLSRGARHCEWSGVDADDVEAIEAPAIDRFGREAGRKVYWVRPQHRAAFLAWNAVLVRRARWLLPLLAVWIVMMVAAAALTVSLVAVGAGLVALGLLVFTLPYATPETVEMLGIRRSMLVVRALAIAMCAVPGILFIVGGLFIALPAR